MDREKARQARRRAEIILQVRSGQLSASEAARILGVSRKTYYQWEKRALAGMLENLENREPGRPQAPKPDREKLRMEKKIEELEKRLDLMAEVYDLREMLAELRAADRSKTKKATPKKKPTRGSSRKGRKKKR